MGSKVWWLCGGRGRVSQKSRDGPDDPPPTSHIRRGVGCVRCRSELEFTWKLIESFVPNSLPNSLLCHIVFQSIRHCGTNDANEWLHTAYESYATYSKCERGRKENNRIWVISFKFTSEFTSKSTQFLCQIHLISNSLGNPSPQMTSIQSLLKFTYQPCSISCRVFQNAESFSACAERYK